jgi:C4-dicarboxylate transporter, DctQ subunit
MSRLYDAIVDTLAWVAGVGLVVMFASVIVDVSIRQLGGQPPEWAVPLSEYLLLYSTLLGAPWLLRERGHVFVDLFVRRGSDTTRRLLERATCVVCALACLLVAGVAADITWREWVAGSADVRAVLIPKWLLFAPLVPGFLLTGIEFLRPLAGGRSLYDAGADGSGVG